MNMNGFKKPARILTENMVISSILKTVKTTNFPATGAATLEDLYGNLCPVIRINSIFTFFTKNSRI